MNNPDKLPPHSLDAEKAVLGSLLLVSELGEDVAANVQPEDFYSDAHQRIARLIWGMIRCDERIDENLLVERLKEIGDFETIGGAVYLFEIIDSVATPATAPEMAKIIKAHAQRRELNRAIETAQHVIDRTATEPGKICADLETKLRAIADGTPGVGVIDSAEAAIQVRGRISELRAGPRRDGISIGLADVDRDIGGMFPQELIVLAARTSVGKTALAMQISGYVSQRGRNVLYVTCEMAAVELAMRLACSRARVDTNFLRTGQLADQHLDAIETAADSLENVYYFDRPGASVAEVRRRARQVQRQHGLQLVVIDHLTLLKPADTRPKRHEQVGQMSRDLKQLARELNLPILCLAQLNRDAEKSSDGKPRLIHLRESGDIEQDADAVWLLHRSDTKASAEQTDDTGKAELIVAKNRAGRIGSFDLAWDSNASSYITPAKQCDRDEYTDGGYFQ